MKISRLYRLIELLTLLRSGRRYNADELARELGVSRRTVFRDLNILSAAGIPYYYDPERRTYSLESSFFLPTLNLTLDESISILIALREIIGKLPLPLADKAIRAAIKIESSLPSIIQRYCEPLLEKIGVRLSPVEEDRLLDKRFSVLREAISGQYKVSMVYESLFDAGNKNPYGKVIETILSPYRLVFIQRAWYVIGYSSFHKGVRTFKLSRIRDLELLDEKYVNWGFSLESYMGDAWVMIPEGRKYKVELIFSPRVARNVAEINWHKSQECYFLSDGSLRFTVEVDGIGEIFWWIMGYADEVKVVKPKKLAQMVCKAAERILKLYGREEKIYAGTH